MLQADQPATAAARGVPVMRLLSALWYWCRVPYWFVADLQPWGRWVVVGLLLATVGGGFAAYRIEKQRRATRHAAVAWEKVRQFASRQDVPNLRRALDLIRELTPNDPLLARWDETLRTGRAHPGDLGMVRMMMNEHLRTERLDDAAREAAVRVATLPQDWQSRCVLAHAELKQGNTEAARKHMRFLPSPFDLEYGIGPGSVLYAIHLSRQLDLSTTDLMRYLVSLVPGLKSEHFPHLSVNERLQLLEAYVHSFTALDAHAETIVPLWVKAGTACGQVLNDPAASVADLVRLGHVFEGLQPILAELRRRGHLKPMEGEDLLAKELQTRIEAVWTKVNERDPSRVEAYVGLALSHARAGRTAEADAVLKRGRAACGDKPELLAAQARFLQATDPAAAVELIDRVVRSRPKDLALLLVLAESAESARRPDVVLRAAKDALAVQPDLPWACKALARAHLGRGEGREAAAALAPIRDACAVDADAAELYVATACAAGTLADLDPFLKKVKAGSKPGLPLAGGAAALLSAKQVEHAVQWAEEAVQHLPNDRTVRVLLADSRRDRAEQANAPEWNDGYVRQAIDAYVWLRDHNPNDLAVANNIAWLELKGLNRPQAAFKSAAPLRAKEDSADLPPDMLETLGAIYLAIGQEDRAVKLLERATQAEPFRPGFLTHLALAYLQLDRRNDARQCLNRAANLTKSTREAAEYARAVRLAQSEPGAVPGFPKP